MWHLLFWGPDMLINVDGLIYEKFYVAAEQAGIVWTLNQLGIRDGLLDPEDEEDPMNVPLYHEHGQAIRHVLEMEISIFVFRRLNGCWGEVIDGMQNRINIFTNEYREKTGYQIDTKQKDLIWS